MKCWSFEEVLSQTGQRAKASWLSAGCLWLAYAEFIVPSAINAIILSSTSIVANKISIRCRNNPFHIRISSNFEFHLTRVDSECFFFFDYIFFLVILSPKPHQPSTINHQLSEAFARSLARSFLTPSLSPSINCISVRLLTRSQSPHQLASFYIPLKKLINK